LFDRFRDIVVSGTAKIAKPDPAIYQLAIRRFGIDPAGALFIDDRADNVAAAEAMGMAGHVFTDAAALKAELVARGFL
jgi:2-haloacid dehalogenase